MGVAVAARRTRRPQRLAVLHIQAADDADRRPSHANRRKALRRLILDQQLNALATATSLPSKILALAKNLIAMAA